ncbi:hypothetical protein R6Q57_008742 [Mikania cordata]
MSSVFGTGEISTSDEYLHEIIGFVRVPKDGRCERLIGNKMLPAGIHSSTGVESKDVVISPETDLSARLYIPKTAATDRKLPILMFFHGGGFVAGSAKNSDYHPTVNHLTAVLNVFLAGDSAGANIAHNMAIRFGLDSNRIVGINLAGIIMLHPYFGGKDPIGSELGKHKQLKAFTDQFWNLANRSASGLDDPLFNPEKDPNLSGLGCSKILLLVAEKDSFRDRGLLYKGLMEKSGWPGKLEMLESKDEDHVFFLFDHISQNACTLYNKICTFINHGDDQSLV